MLEQLSRVLPVECYRVPMGTKRVPFGEWLRAEIDKAGLSVSDAARKIGVPPATVSRWINGSRVPLSDSCHLIATGLDINPDVVLFMAGHTRALDRALPEYERARDIRTLTRVAETLTREELDRYISVQSWGRIPADSFRWEQASTGREEPPVRVPAEYIGTRSLKDLFVVQASGKCLVDLAIDDGDLVLCRRLYHEQPDEGDVVVARIGDEYTLKVFHREGDWIHLQDGTGTTVYSVSIIDADELDIQGVKLYRWEPSKE